MGEREISQIPAMQVLDKLGYKYIQADEVELMRGNSYDVLLKPILKDKLKELNSFEYRNKIYKFSDKNINQAINDIDESLIDGLVKTNEKIYEKLMLGSSYVENLDDGASKSFNIKYIDWEKPYNNDFHIVEEFSVEREDGSSNIRPDIVLFINGIPFGVIECKSSTISVEQGISQMIRNQNKDYIPQLFKYIQIAIATNKNNTKYATCNTPKKFWNVWKEQENEWLENNIKNVVEDRKATNQDRNIVSLLHPDRILDIIKYFIVFDKDVKKIARYQQFFAIKEILKTINEEDRNGNRQSGVVWHTQGSGKSLTMVMLAKYILSELSDCNPKVIVVTDRVELDKQIHRTFNHTKLKAIQAKTGSHLINLIEDDNADIVTTLVHKFDTASRNGAKLESKNIFVLIDESHRTQYGELHIKMKRVFPNACYIGFTGTPLMKNEKNTMMKFGKLIHKYTITDGVEDKAILPLLYEGKMVDQSVNRKAIDNQLSIITRHLNDKQKDEVMKKWSRFDRIASSDQRIKLIAFDINEHFRKNYKTLGSQFKAMLATNSRSEAIKYLRAFEDLGDLNVGVVMSPPDTREGHDEVDKESKDIIIQFWNEMMNEYENAEDYEESLKNEFTYGELDIIIVVDKLLTGFDAPRATVLYIDKLMKEHTLLQAIARVNRLYEGKDYGFIIDYRGLFDKLDEAMNMYSGECLDGFESQDIKGAMKDVANIIGDLRQHYTNLKGIFSNISNENDQEEYEVFLSDDKKRDDFYEILSKFSRSLSIALQSEEIYNVLGSDELNKYKKELKFYQKLRISVKLRYSDTVDHKEYELKMQNLMDNYIAAEEIIRITNPVDIHDKNGCDEELSRLNSKRAKADAIRTKLVRSISTKWDENPAYYKKFSERIEEIIEEYKNKRISESEYFEKMQDIRNQYTENQDDTYYPDIIKDNSKAQAFYGVVDEVVKESCESYSDTDILGKIALEIDNIMNNNIKRDWYENKDIHNKIAQEIDDLIYEFTEQYNIDLTFDHIDKIIEKAIKIGQKRY